MRLFLAWMVCSIALIAACSSSTTVSPDASAATDAGIDASQIAASDAAADVRRGRDANADSRIEPCSVGCNIVELVAGSNFNCARRENGTVLCWGGNRSGQLGDGIGSVVNRHSDCPLTGMAQMRDCTVNPVFVTGATDATNLSAAFASACLRDRTGAMRCWGFEPSPTGTNVDLASPIVVPGLPGAASQIVTGALVRCAVMAGGELFCQGADQSQFFGNSADAGVSFTSTFIPLRHVPALSKMVLAPFSNYGCGVRTDGTVTCWGSNASGQLGDGVTHATCGTGTDAYDCSPTPVVVQGLSNVTQLSLSSLFACARRANGTAVCWGSNTKGMLGIGTSTDARTPAMDLPLTSVEQVSTGPTFACARLTNNEVHCWGTNESGQLGDGLTDHGTQCLPDRRDCSLSPVRVSLPNRAASIIGITSGFDHTCVLYADSKVYCWGENVDYQLGYITSRDPQSRPVEMMFDLTQN